MARFGKFDYELVQFSGRTLQLQAQNTIFALAILYSHTYYSMPITQDAPSAQQLLEAGDVSPDEWQQLLKDEQLSMHATLC